MPVGHYDRTRIPRRGRPGFLRTILGDLDREWMVQAECARLLAADIPADRRRVIGQELDEMFFPINGRSHDAKAVYDAKVARAKTLCRSCPVAAQCEAYRASLQDENGVWGGRDEQDRDSRRRPPPAHPRNGRLRSSQEGTSHT